MARIELHDVSLTFQVRSHARITLKEFLLRRTIGRMRAATVEVRALRHVNLQIASGERIGIIGHNGAGKSTLLKVLAGIYPPSDGQRVVEGTISSLFDIALGFEMDASGWENIRYRGYLQGETPSTIRDKIHEIAQFSELGEFLDMPVRYYSAGMLCRLAFAIATAIEPEILLVDEVLAVGDLAFQHKARQRMESMMARAKIIVLVSHGLDSLARLCDRGVWLDHGEVRFAGPIAEAVAAYTEHVRSAQAA